MARMLRLFLGIPMGLLRLLIGFARASVRGLLGAPAATMRFSRSLAMFPVAAALAIGVQYWWALEQAIDSENMVAEILWAYAVPVLLLGAGLAQWRYLRSVPRDRTIFFLSVLTSLVLTIGLLVANAHRFDTNYHVTKKLIELGEAQTKVQGAVDNLEGRPAPLTAAGALDLQKLGFSGCPGNASWSPCPYQFVVSGGKVAFVNRDDFAVPHPVYTRFTTPAGMVHLLGWLGIFLGMSAVFFVWSGRMSEKQVVADRHYYESRGLSM
jgi:hypothetical protein